MNRDVLKTLLLVITVTLVTISLPARNQFGQVSTELHAKPKLREILSKHSALPPSAQFGQAQAESAQDQERLQSRQRVSHGLYSGKKRLFDPGTREVNGQAETFDLKFINGVKITKPGERKDLAGLPVSDSIIVIGTVLSGKAYVNQESTGVFSEYRVVVNEVLKPDPETVISARAELTTWRPGGSVQFHSGHLKHFIISGRGFPEVGTQYVFFLRRADKEVIDYAISTAFSIKDQVVSPLDDGQDQTSFDGMRLSDFLDKLRQEIAVREPGGMEQ